MRTLRRNAGAYVALLVVVIFFSVHDDRFRQPSNLLNVLDQSAEIAVVAIGMTAIILTAGIDLSVGSVAALAPFVGAWAITSHTGALGFIAGSAAAGWIVTLAVGGLFGAANGLAITKAHVPPFIATLGMMSVARGLAFVVSHATGYGSGISSGLPEGFTLTARNLIALRSANGPGVNLTVAVLVMVVMMIVGHVVLSRTRWGRAIYAIGGNEQAARLSGLRVDRIKLGVYVIGGLMAALAGLIECAAVGAAAPDAARDLELNAIAAVVIGGTSLTGGSGSLIGTFAGALLMRVIRNGLNLSQVDSNWQNVTIGLIIMAAVAFDEYQKRRSLRA